MGLPLRQEDIHHDLGVRGDDASLFVFDDRLPFDQFFHIAMRAKPMAKQGSGGSPRSRISIILIPASHSRNRLQYRPPAEAGAIEVGLGGVKAGNR
jgi:hypothetical protein